MADDLKSFDFEFYLQDEALRLVFARERGIRLHHTGDIRAAGDETEIPIRGVLKRKLPSGYYVGHGHIVDKTLKTSGQLDVIIADTFGSHPLLKSDNETEYFPYESIYAIGEAKSSYKKQHVADFITKRKQIEKGLNRKQTDPNQVYRGQGNPMFSFMLFVNSDGFKAVDLTEMYRNDGGFFTPNVICLLDRGIVASISFFDAPREDYFSISRRN